MFEKAPIYRILYYDDEKITLIRENGIHGEALNEEELYFNNVAMIRVNNGNYEIVCTDSRIILTASSPIFRTGTWMVVNGGSV